MSTQAWPNPPSASPTERLPAQVTQSLSHSVTQSLSHSVTQSHLHTSSHSLAGSMNMGRRRNSRGNILEEEGFRYSAWMSRCHHHADWKASKILTLNLNFSAWLHFFRICFTSFMAKGQIKSLIECMAPYVGFLLTAEVFSLWSGPSLPSCKMVFLWRYDQRILFCLQYDVENALVASDGNANVTANDDVDKDYVEDEEVSVPQFPDRPQDGGHRCRCHGGLGQPGLDGDMAGGSLVCR